MLKIKLLNTIILSFISLGVFGQIFDSEQNPLSVKFRKISTSGFTILYPTELEKEAQRMANTLVKIYPEIAKDLKAQKTTIPVVGRSKRCTTPKKTSPGLLYFSLMYSFTTSDNGLSPVLSPCTISPTRLLMTIM